MSHEHAITTGDGVFTALPIAAYGLLAGCNTAALVGIDGSIDWLCLPRYDSPSIFARILDTDAGHWSIRPTGSYEATRRYVPGTLLIETTFSTTRGAVRLTDGFAFAEGRRGHKLGRPLFRTTPTGAVTISGPDRFGLAAAVPLAVLVHELRAACRAQ